MRLNHKNAIIKMDEQRAQRYKLNSFCHSLPLALASHSLSLSLLLLPSCCFISLRLLLFVAFGFYELRRVPTLLQFLP